MFSLLLVIIYIIYISLGLPDSLLGSAWPIMHSDLNVPLSYMGLLSMIMACGTIISSLFTDRLLKRLGTGMLTAVSILLTAVGMLGFGLSDSFLQLCLWAVPYGLGAGAVDAVISNYAALNYAAKHMNWLHCCWGVGTVISPYIMGSLLTGGSSWNSGYFIVAIIQGAITLLVFISVPWWKKANTDYEADTAEPVKKLALLRIKGVPLMLLLFFCYCALEVTAGSWASSYLCEYRGYTEESAAFFASLFYIGITAGRIISGFVAERFGNKKLIRTGVIVVLAGIVLLAIPVASDPLIIAGLLVIGFGCAPVYPCLMSATPVYFGKDKSISIVSMQLASAYIGVNFMPMLFGFLTDRLWDGLYPYYLLVFGVLMLVLTELLYKAVNDK